MFDGIIFDVDGTLWDITGITADAWTKYIHSKGVDDLVITSERLQQLFGQLLPDIARQLFPFLNSEEQLELIQGCCEAEHEAIRSAAVSPLYPHILEVIKTLSQKYPIFIVSNCQAGYIELFIEKNNVNDYITDHLCPGDSGEAKAANIRTIVAKHHLKAPVYVGDTMGDFNACQEAGVPFIFASYGFGEVSDAYAVIDTPEDLLQIFSE